MDVLIDQDRGKKHDQNPEEAEDQMQEEMKQGQITESFAKERRITDSSHK